MRPMKRGASSDTHGGRLVSRRARMRTMSSWLSGSARLRALAILRADFNAPEGGGCLLRERLFCSPAGDSHLLGQRVWSVEAFTEEKDFADRLEQPWRMDGTAL